VTWQSKLHMAWSELTRIYTMPFSTAHVGVSIICRINQRK
jgi:hypothetical protein